MALPMMVPMAVHSNLVKAVLAADLAQLMPARLLARTFDALDRIPHMLGPACAAQHPWSSCPASTPPTLSAVAPVPPPPPEAPRPDPGLLLPRPCGATLPVPEHLPPHSHGGDRAGAALGAAAGPALPVPPGDGRAPAHPNRPHPGIGAADRGMALVLVRNTKARQSAFDADEIKDLGDQVEEREVLRRNSNIVRMQTAFEVKKAKAKGLMKDDDPDLISQDAFRDIVRDARERFVGCLSLPSTFFVFIMFASSTYLHADVMNAYLVESVLGEHLGAGAENVESIADTWSWLEGPMTTKFYGDGSVAETNHTNKGNFRPVLNYNYLVGPIALTQIRSEKSLCEKEGFQDMMCFPQGSRDTSAYGGAAPAIQAPNRDEYFGSTVSLAERRAFWNSAFVPVAQREMEGRLLRSVGGAVGDLPPVAQLGGQQDEEIFNAMLFPNVLRSTLMEQLSYLKRRGWLDEQTLSLKITANLLNSEVGRPRLTQFMVIFYYSRAGGVFADVEVNTVMLQFWESYASFSLAADCVYFICLVIMTVVQVRLLISKDINKWKKMRSFWNILQWSIVITGWACIGFHLFTYLLTSAALPPYKEMVQAQQQDVPAETNVLGTEMHSAVEALVFCNGMTRVFFAMYHVLLMIRFFTAFHAQPRLGVVTRTLEVSLIDILHFLVVLLPTFMSYAISGCFIFGKRVKDFSNLIASTGTCFKIFMESEYNWPELSEEDFWTPFVWVLTFMVLLVMIMLNMVLAIILDVYTEIRKKSGQSEPVWVTGYHMCQQIYHYRHWISTQDLLDKVPFMPANISRADIYEAFPNICEEQVEQLYSAARYHHFSSEQGNEKDARKIALAVKLVMDDIGTNMQQLDNGICDNRDFHQDEKGWLPDLAREMAVQNHMMLSLQWHLQQIEWQWQAMEAVHGSDANFQGQHKLPKGDGEVVY